MEYSKHVLLESSVITLCQGYSSFGKQPGGDPSHHARVPSQKKLLLVLTMTFPTAVE